MDVLAIMLVIAVVVAAVIYRIDLGRCDVERRAMRSLKASLERAENTPKRRLLALSRMTL